MSEGLNRVMLLGNLGQDPELRFTQGGSAVLNMRLATTESYIDRDKVRKERTDWHNVVVWGKRAEGLAKILVKGSSILVEGSIRTSSFEGRDGQKRYKTEINARNILLTGGRGDRAAQQQQESQQSYQQPRGDGGYSASRPDNSPGPAGANGDVDFGPDDDAIPF